MCVKCNNNSCSGGCNTTRQINITDDSVGRDGESAYEIAVREGYEGTEEEWLESLNGSTVLFGEGVPVEEGNSSDIYIDLSTANVYGWNTLTENWDLKGAIQNTEGWNKRVPINSDDAVKQFGDSFTAGTTTPPENGYAYIIANALRKLSYNYGFGGSGAFQAAYRANLQLAVGNTSPVTAMFGFNDIRFGNDLVKTGNKIKSAAQTIMATAWLEEAFAGNDAEITKSGIWTEVDDEELSGKGYLLGSAIVSTGLTAYVEYTTNRDNVIIQTINSDGSVLNTDDVDIYIDGVLYSTYISSGKTDGEEILSHDDVAISGIIALFNLGGSADTRTIKIQKKSIRPFYISYIGSLKKPGECAPVVFGEIPYMNQAGYDLVGGSKAKANNGTKYIIEAIKEFALQGLPVALAHVNSFYTLDNVSVDLVHANYKGNGQIASAFLDRFLSSSQDGLEQILNRNNVSVLDIKAKDGYFARSATTGVMYLGSNGAHFLYFDGTKYTLANGDIHVNGMALINTPSTSAGGYDILTRHNSTGVIEKISGLSLGLWTPISPDVTLTVNAAYFQKFGNIVQAFFNVTFPVSASGSPVKIQGLPISVTSGYPLNVSINDSGLNILGETYSVDATLLLYDNTHTAITYAQMSGKQLAGLITYKIA